ncbi:hypothetical protein C815_02131 [Firmicutes bacterium M10-2]|nr:hypothetical protein C815_02131 [Firmicutes bacterium M10-2]
MKRQYYIQNSLSDCPDYRKFCAKVGSGNIHIFTDRKELNNLASSSIVIYDERSQFPELGIWAYRIRDPKNVIHFTTLDPMIRYYFLIMNFLTALIVIAFVISAILYCTSFSMTALYWMIGLALTTGILIFKPLSIEMLIAIIVIGAICVYSFA